MQYDEIRSGFILVNESMDIIKSEGLAKPSASFACEYGEFGPFPRVQGRYFIAEKWEDIPELLFETANEAISWKLYFDAKKRINNKHRLYKYVLRSAKMYGSFTSYTREAADDRRDWEADIKSQYAIFNVEWALFYAGGKEVLRSFGEGPVHCYSNAKYFDSKEEALAMVAELLIRNRDMKKDMMRVVEYKLIPKWTGYYIEVCD